MTTCDQIATKTQSADAADLGVMSLKSWSERQDSNLRPLDPQSSALPEGDRSETEKHNDFNDGNHPATRVKRERMVNCDQNATKYLVAVVN